MLTKKMDPDLYPLNYSLPRAGPRNFNRFKSSNLLAPKITKFNYASTGIKDVNKISIETILALEIDEKMNESIAIQSNLFPKRWSTSKLSKAASASSRLNNPLGLCSLTS